FKPGSLVIAEHDDRAVLITRHVHIKTNIAVELQRFFQVTNPQGDEVDSIHELDASVPHRQRAVQAMRYFAVARIRYRSDLVLGVPSFDHSHDLVTHELKKCMSLLKARAGRRVGPDSLDTVGQAVEHRLKRAVFLNHRLIPGVVSDGEMIRSLARLADTLHEVHLLEISRRAAHGGRANL